VKGTALHAKIRSRLPALVRSPASRRSVSRYAGVLSGLLIVCVALTMTQPTFLTWSNWQNIFRSQAVVFILAGGMTFVVLTGGFDLSVASATALTASLFGILLVHGSSWWIAVLAALGLGSILGAVNGYLISVVRIPFFVVTLGTLSIYSGVALVITGGNTQTLYSVSAFKPIGDLATNNVGPFPLVLIVVVALFAAGALILGHTVFGRHIYATGSNVEAARLSGVRIASVTLAVYAIAGLLTGVAGIVQTGRLSAGSPQVDPNLMLTVVAAVLLGGTSFSGGEGGMLGTAIGVMFLGVVDNGLALSNVSTFWQGVVSGAILIAAVGLGVVRRPGWSWQRLVGRIRGRDQGLDLASTE
jgi:ribose transport system permease protein